MMMSFCRRDIVILPRRHCRSAAETLSFCRRERVRMEQRHSEDYPDCQRGRSKGTVRSVRTHKDSFESMLLSHESLFFLQECENVPPFLPSPHSKTYVQRADDTGGISVLPPVSLPPSRALPHLHPAWLNHDEMGRIFISKKARFEMLKRLFLDLKTCKTQNFFVSLQSIWKYHGTHTQTMKNLP